MAQELTALATLLFQGLYGFSSYHSQVGSQAPVMLDPVGLMVCLGFLRHCIQLHAYGIQIYMQEKPHVHKIFFK